MLSDGRIHHLARGHVVRILDVMDYRVVRVNPKTQSVMVQRINSCDRPLGKNAKELWLPPPQTTSQQTDSQAAEQFPLMCDCPSPVPPPVLPDTVDVAVETFMEADECLNLVAEGFDSVQALKSQLDELTMAKQTVFNLLQASVDMCRTREQELAESENKIKSMQQQLNALTTENEELLKRTFQQTEELTNLKLEAATVSQHKLTADFLMHQLSTYPIDLDYPPPNVLFDLLCLEPTTDQEKIQNHARHLLRLFHLDKNPQVLMRVAQLIPVIKEAKHVLGDRALNKVYQCCGMEGVRRARRRLRACMDFDPLIADWMDL